VSAFAAAFGALQPAFDAAFGEPVLIEPQVGTARRNRYVVGGADPAKQPRQITGIFRGQTVVDRVQSGATNSETADVLAQQTTVDFAAALFDDTTMPQEGWVVVLTSRTGQPRWRIAAVKPDFVARIVCSLTFLDNSA